VKQRALAVAAISLMFGALGCASKSDWKSHVIATKENPRNGRYDTSPIRAEVVTYRCGVLHRKCTTVRLVHEIGTDDVFTFIGSDRSVSINWPDENNLQVTCLDCGKTIVRLPDMDHIHINYELKRS
jgi:hypothetical protein